MHTAHGKPIYRGYLKGMLSWYVGEQYCRIENCDLKHSTAESMILNNFEIV